ncbi:MAG: Gfo/Idh/MocA family oxidoreductase [Anaerolineae bacterium]
MKTVNVALIGHRFMGKAHTHAYTDVTVFFDPKLRPVKRVLCATSDDVADVAGKWGWQEWETDWQQVVTRPDIDIVDICAPSKIHKEIALAAAEAGKHIFCEKPLAMNLADARQMVAAVEEAKVAHTIGFNYRKVPALALARRLIEQGQLGKIHHFRGIYSQDWLVDPSFPLAWRLRKKDAGAGSSWDLGAHVVDQARFLVGELSEVVGMQTTFIKERPVAAFEEGLKAVAGETMGRVDVDDATSFLARFENGAMGLFEFTRYGTGHRNQNRIEVYGSEGGMVFDMERMNELLFYSRKDPADTQGYRLIQVGEDTHPYMSAWWPAGHIIGFGDTFVHEVFDFLEAIGDNKPASPSFQDGLRCQEILVAVDRSIAERRWVSMEELA